MDPRSDEPPRITAEEADARFAALVAEYRGGRTKARAPRRASPAEADAPPAVSPGDPPAARSAAPLSGALAPAALFIAGFACGVVGRARPWSTLLIGLVLVLAARALYRRWRRDGERRDG